MRTERPSSEHSRRTELVALLALVLLACEPDDPVPFAPGRDGSIERPDSGPRFVHADSGIDAGPLPDSGLFPDDGGRLPDGGALPTDPVIDGVLGETEWAGALEQTADVASLPPFVGDHLSRLLAIRAETRLYLAIEATLVTGHALVAYLDADFDQANGVLLISGNELADGTGTLDRALSAPLISNLGGSLRPDYAWGTTMMPIALSGSGDLGGWREIATSSTDFATIAVGNRTTCSATVCETSIPLDGSGIAGAQTIAIFVRIVDATGSLSNQTLPLEAGGTPEFVSEVLLVPPPAGGT